MEVFRGQSSPHQLLLNVNLLSLSVYFFGKRRHQRALLHKLIRAGELLEVVIDLGKPVVAPRKDDDEEGHHSREPLELPVPAGKHLQGSYLKLMIKLTPALIQTTLWLSYQIYISKSSQLMGTACSKADNQTMTPTPPGGLMKYANEPKLNEIAKESQLIETRFKTAQVYVEKYKIIFDHEDSKLETLSPTAQSNIKEQLQELQDLQGLTDKVNKGIEDLQSLLGSLKDSENVKSFGQQSVKAQEQLKQQEELVQQYEKQINDIKENWVDTLFSEGEKQRLLTKLDTKNKKLEAQISQSKKATEGIQQDIEETKEYLTGVTDIKGFELYTEVTRIILEDLEKVNARLEAASKEVTEASQQSLEYKEQSVEDSILQSDFDTVYELSSNISNLTAQLNQSMVDLEGQTQHIKDQVRLVSDFGLYRSIQAIQNEEKELLKENISKTQGSLIQFKEATDLEMLSTADEDQIQNLKDILSEVEQLQASCVNISDIEKTHNQEMDTLIQRGQALKQKESISLKEFSLLMGDFSLIKEKLLNLVGDIQELDKEIELKKVETGTLNSKVKLNSSSTILDHQNNYLQEASAQADDLFNALEKLKSQYSGLENPFSKIVSAQLSVIFKQMSDGSEEQALIKNLSDIEMKINNLMNFVTEKEESGEGISTAEDAEQLMDGMADIEENLQKSEVKSVRVLVDTQSRMSYLSDVVYRQKEQVDKLIFVYAQVYKYLIELKETKGAAVEEEAKQEHRVTEFTNRTKELFSDDSDSSQKKIGQIVANGMLIASLVEDVFQSVLKAVSQLEGEVAASQLDLQWSIDNTQVYNETEMGPGVYKTKSYDYKPLNINDEVEKKLVEQHKEDPRVSILPITNLGKNQYQFGKSYKATLKVIDDVLCAFLAGGYIPFEDFVRLQYLTILEKEDFKPFKKVINEKEKKIGSLLQSLEIKE